MFKRICFTLVALDEDYVVVMQFRGDHLGVAMKFFPILNVNNYNEMLAKLGWYSAFVSLVSIFILRSNVPPIQSLSAYIDKIVPNDIAGVLPFPVSLAGVFVISILVGIVAHSIKLHDRLSDLFRIRKEFDVNFVLYPLAIASGAKISPAQLDRIKQNRSALMGSTFYAYVSSTKPVIDSHTITQSLTNWSWFWVLLEAQGILSVTAVLLAIYGAWFQTAMVLFACIFMLVPMRFFRLQSAKYAESQVQQVLRDTVRRADVAAEFNAV